MKKKKWTFGKVLGLVASLALWVATLVYSNWYLYNGFSSKNAIMEYCSQFNDTSLGWFEYIFGHGVLNFVAGTGAILPLLVPIAVLILACRKKTLGQIVGKVFELFLNALFGVAMIAGVLYGALYTMEELPLLAGFLLIVGVGMLVPTGKGIILIVISD